MYWKGFLTENAAGFPSTLYNIKLSTLLNNDCSNVGSNLPKNFDKQMCMGSKLDGQGVCYGKLINFIK